MNVKGQAALVTGGASGLGAATAAALRAAGAKVAVLDINPAAVEAAVAATGCFGAVCDVADPDSAALAIAAAAAENGPARILVNCAGVGTPARILGREGAAPLSGYEKVIRVNLIGTFNMLRLAAEAMAGLEPLADGERGVVINTASVAAYEGQIGQAAYASSKAGVVGLTLPAARELARVGIRVTTIAPGLFGTPMLRGLPEEVQASLGASVPFPARLGEPEEYAALAMHIVANRMLNGETIRLDGALRMAPR